MFSAFVLILLYRLRWANHGNAGFYERRKRRDLWVLATSSVTFTPLTSVVYVTNNVDGKVHETVLDRSARLAASVSCDA